MKFSERMTQELIRKGEYNTKKWHFTLGWNLYGQEVVEKAAIMEDGRISKYRRSVGLFVRPRDY